WNYADFPLVEVGKLTLNRNADNYFADVEQAGFDPGSFVPGIGPSPDRMLQGRLFAYSDAHRYRLGINHTHLPVNAPHATTAQNYGRDGFMTAGANGGRSKNYEPNSFDGPVQTNEPHYKGIEGVGPSGHYEWPQRETDYFTQAGDLYRLQDNAAQQRLVDNLATGLADIDPADPKGIVERSLSYFTNADPEYGARIRARIDEIRSAKAHG
ncbi:MAG: catalase, partial [Actinobacteria bacterium]|nr:catalase [Actinomycetota bacterium]